MCSFARRSPSPMLSGAGVGASCPRCKKVSPDHILNESVLRSEDPLSTAVLLALSKTEPKGSQREKGVGGEECGERRGKERRPSGGKVDVMYLALSPATPCHTAPRHAVPSHTMPRRSRFALFMRCHDITRVPMACMSIVRRCPFEISLVCNCPRSVYAVRKTTR